MNIFIPTRGRLHNQVTLRYLHGAVKPIIVAPFSELMTFWNDDVVQGGRHVYGDLYDRAVGVPDDYKFSDIRQFLVQVYGGRQVCIDDDLRFYRRIPGTVKLRMAEKADLVELFQWVEGRFEDGFVHGGVSAREGNNRVEDLEVQATRCMRFHFYVSEFLKYINFDFRDVVTKQDFHCTLSCLRAGEPNIVNYEFAHNQDGSNTDGGCSRYRTEEIMRAGAHRLAELHPGFVKVVEKTTKKAWGGGQRTDVTVYWKKAFLSSDS